MLLPEVPQICSSLSPSALSRSFPSEKSAFLIPEPRICAQRAVAMSSACFQTLNGTTFGSLLRELKQIWEEIGESDGEVERALLQLEEECLQVYRRRVEEASQCRARLHRSVAEKEAELATLYVVLGNCPTAPKKTMSEPRPRSLKAQLSAIAPQLEEFRSKKEERMKQFAEVTSQIEKISSEISGGNDSSEHRPSEEEDLSIRRLDELRDRLQGLQKEKSERLHKVLGWVSTLHGLCSVLGLDFTQTINDVHPSLNESSNYQTKSISDETLERLSDAVQRITNEKQQRTETLQSLLASLVELWKLLDTPLREQKGFHHMIRQGDTISGPGALSLETIEQVKMEIQKLEKLKASKMKELVLKKRLVLEDVCRQAHMEPDPSTTSDKTNALIDSGMVEASELLVNIEEQILRAEYEAESRKEVLERVDKWFAACEEERWLEDYSMDHNRYSATKGAHLNLKRAEKARITVTKLPALVDGLIAKTRAWEEEKGMCFLFDGMRLLSMLDDYIFNRHEREDEKRRMRDQKRMQDQLMNAKEAVYGSKPSPTRLTPKRVGGARSTTPSAPSTPRRSPSSTVMGLGSSRLSTPDSTPRSNSGHSKYSSPFGRARSSSFGTPPPPPRPSGPLNFVAMQHKDDSLSVFSAGGSDSSSPLGSSAYS